METHLKEAPTLNPYIAGDLYCRADCCTLAPPGPFTTTNRQGRWSGHKHDDWDGQSGVRISNTSVTGWTPTTWAQWEAVPHPTQNLISLFGSKKVLYNIWKYIICVRSCFGFRMTYYHSCSFIQQHCIKSSGMAIKSTNKWGSILLLLAARMTNSLISIHWNCPVWEQIW